MTSDDAARGAQPGTEAGPYRIRGWRHAHARCDECSRLEAAFREAEGRTGIDVERLARIEQAARDYITEYDAPYVGGDDDWERLEGAPRDRLRAALAADPRPTRRILFVVNPAMFGEGPPGDPFPCDCGDVCHVVEHNRTVQEWYRRNAAYPRPLHSDPEMQARCDGKCASDECICLAPDE